MRFFLLFQIIFLMSGCSVLESKLNSTLNSGDLNEDQATESTVAEKKTDTSVIKRSDTQSPPPIEDHSPLSFLELQQETFEEEIRHDLVQLSLSEQETEKTVDTEFSSSFLDYILEQPITTKTNESDYSEYGFITPTKSLEQVLNQELNSLRHTEAELDVSNNLFNRIRNGFSFDLSLDNKRIQAQLNWYVNNPDYLKRTFTRSSRYLFYIVEQLEKHNLPLELALLPLVESAYDPFAYSHGRASGLWQFIPGTGKIYGMHQNWWYDGRRDVLSSTQGAIKYLSHLNKIFDGDWLHALASYNSGSGRVSKAIRRNNKRGKPTDFWSLKLPRETRAYVPKLIAIAKVVANPERYNIELPAIENKPYFAVVNIDSQLDLAQAAKLAEIDITELYKLNPGFNQWATNPLGPHRILVPINKAATFQQNLAELPPEKRISWKRYSVKSGDSLIKIAKKFNTTPPLIKQINNLSSNTIRVKQKLLIPIASKSSQFYGLNEDNRLKNKQANIKQSPGSSKVIHTVKTGDTIWELARQHNVSVRSIAKWNGMAPKDVLKPGQKLLIWSKAQSFQNSALSAANIPARNMIKRIGYRVKRGDSLARIASKFSVRVKDLISWNKLDKRKYLQPGQKLTIYVDITRS